MKKNKESLNWEKLSVYAACLTVIILLWTSLSQVNREISDVKERIARLEARVESLQKSDKKCII